MVLTVDYIKTVPGNTKKRGRREIDERIL